MTKKEKDKLFETYDNFKKELVEYNSSAKRMEYKPIIPRLPKRTQEPELLRSTIVGFSGRFLNWKQNFIKFKESKTNE